MIGFSSPQTLTDASTSIIKGHDGDLKILNPTLMHAVPAVLERFAKAVNLKLANSSWLKKKLFDIASKQKLKFVKARKNAFLLDKILFKKISEAVVGKNLRIILSGGSLLNESVHEFIQVTYYFLYQLLNYLNSTRKFSIKGMYFSCYASIWIDRYFVKKKYFKLELNI